jgi:hypothetical protein
MSRHELARFVVATPALTARSAEQVAFAKPKNRAVVAKKRATTEAPVDTAAAERISQVIDRAQTVVSGEAELVFTTGWSMDDHRAFLFPGSRGR